MTSIMAPDKTSAARLHDPAWWANLTAEQRFCTVRQELVDQFGDYTDQYFFGIIDDAYRIADMLPDASDDQVRAATHTAVDAMLEGAEDLPDEVRNILGLTAPRPSP